MSALLLKVVCTDKGQHPERLLAKLERDDRFQGLLFNQLVKKANGRVINDALSVVISTTWPKVGRPRRIFKFTCVTCHRRPRIREDDLEKVIAAGVSLLDISTLPY